MRPTTSLTAAGLAALTLAAGPAMAQGKFKLGQIVITGVTSVPTQPLIDGLKDKPGDMVTVNDVLADQDQLEKELEAAHVTGGIKTALRNNPHSKDILFTVNDTGIQKPVVTTTALHLAHLTFSGNQYMTQDELAAASGLKPGDVITDQVLNDATQKIGAAYKKVSDAKATLAGQTNVAVQYTYPTPGQVDITWTFTQTTKKKKRNTEDEGFHTE
jgi:outer membrane protein assembly factor BamA